MTLTYSIARLAETGLEELTAIYANKWHELETGEADPQERAEFNREIGLIEANGRYRFPTVWDCYIRSGGTPE